MAGLESGQRWTSCDRLDPVDEQPAAGRDGEDSSTTAVEAVRVAVGSRHWLYSKGLEFSRHAPKTCRMLLTQMC